MDRDLGEKLKELNVLHQANKEDQRIRETLFNQKKMIYERGVSKEFEKFISQIDLEGYEIKSYNVGCNAEPPNINGFIIQINEIGNKKRGDETHPYKINEILNKLNIFYIDSQFNGGKEIKEFAEKNYITKITAGI